VCVNAQTLIPRSSSKSFITGQFKAAVFAGVETGTASRSACRNPTRKSYRPCKSNNNAIADAVAELGRPEEIGRIFAGFQKYLYQEAA